MTIHYILNFYEYDQFDLYRHKTYDGEPLKSGFSNEEPLFMSKIHKIYWINFIWSILLSEPFADNYLPKIQNVENLL